VSISQTLRRWTEGATYVRQGDHHVGHWPTFLVYTTSVSFWATICKTVYPMLSIRSGLFCPVLGLLSCPVCDGVLWPNGWMDQDETWHRGRPQPKPHCVRWDRAPSQKGTAPQYSARVYRGQTAGWIKVPLGVEVGLSPGDIVLDVHKRGTAAPQFSTMFVVVNSWMDQDATWYKGKPWPRPLCVIWGPSSTPPKKWGAGVPQFSARVYCIQTAGWIKMPLGMEVGLGPDDIVLDSDPAPCTKKAQHPPFFSQCILWPNGCMDKLPIGTEVGLGPGQWGHMLDGDPSRSSKGAQQPPIITAYTCN